MSDWANTKAAYRFFSIPRISEEEILSGHFASAQVRAAAIQEPLLVLHDTTEFTYKSTGRTDPEIAAGAAIIAQDQTVLDKLFGSPEKADNLSTYLIRIARLGGYLACASDPPPGNAAMWRGLRRLTDIQLGFLLAKGGVGN